MGFFPSVQMFIRPSCGFSSFCPSSTGRCLGEGEKVWMGGSEKAGREENARMFSKEKYCKMGPILINTGFAENMASRVYVAGGVLGLWVALTLLSPAPHHSLMSTSHPHTEEGTAGGCHGDNDQFISLVVCKVGGCKCLNESHITRLQNWGSCGRIESGGFHQDLGADSYPVCASKVTWLGKTALKPTSMSCLCLSADRGLSGNQDRRTDSSVPFS